MKKIKKRQILNYPGIKLKYCDQINEKINQLQEIDVFVEPFCGTTSVTLNLDRDFKRKVINDLSRDIIRVIKSFRDGSFKELADMYADVANNIGDIKKSKEAYYKFRDEGNKKYYGKDTIEEGFFLHMASRAAINSLFRVGPNGFNSSYGARGNVMLITEKEFVEIQTILKDCIFYNQDYVDMLDIYDDTNVLFFLDPPYVDRKVQGSYKDEDKFNQDKFLTRIKNLKGKVIYTDVPSDYIIDFLGSGWNSEVFVNKKNISPGKNKDKKIDYKEAIYCNF